MKRELPGLGFDNCEAFCRRELVGRTIVGVDQPYGEPLYLTLDDGRRFEISANVAEPTSLIMTVREDREIGAFNGAK